VRFTKVSSNPIELARPDHVEHALIDPIGDINV